MIHTRQSAPRATETKTPVTANKSPAPTLPTVAPAWERGLGAPPLMELPFPLQTKLTVNTPGDEFEQQADRVADQVMRMPAPRLRRAPCACGGEAGPDGECAACKAKRPARQIQRRAAPATTAGAPHVAPPIVHQTLQSVGRPLDPATRAWMEPRFGADFSHVRVHSDPQAAASAQAVQARAYTVGNDVVFGAQQYDPHSDSGKRLLAHELAHVQQQDGEHGAVARTRLQRAMNPACHEDPRWFVNQIIEHLIIQTYYKAVVNPQALVEFTIPHSGPEGESGYADIVVPATSASGQHAIYEIKSEREVPAEVPFSPQRQRPFNMRFAPPLDQVQRYLLAAHLYCDGDRQWTRGMSYPAAAFVLPWRPQELLVTWWQSPGFIVYRYFDRARARAALPGLQIRAMPALPAYARIPASLPAEPARAPAYANAGGGSDVSGVGDATADAGYGPAAPRTYSLDPSILPNLRSALLLTLAGTVAAAATTALVAAILAAVAEAAAILSVSEIAALAARLGAMTPAALQALGGLPRAALVSALLPLARSAR